MGCVTLVTQALEELEEIETVQYDGDAHVFEVKLRKGPLPQEKIVQTVEETGRRHDEKLGVSDRPPWKVHFVEQTEDD